MRGSGERGIGDTPRPPDIHGQSGHDFVSAEKERRMRGKYSGNARVCDVFLWCRRTGHVLGKSESYTDALFGLGEVGIAQSSRTVAHQ
jgi:hypothetical protein